MSLNFPLIYYVLSSFLMLLTVRETGAFALQNVLNSVLGSFLPHGFISSVPLIPIFPIN